MSELDDIRSLIVVLPKKDLPEVKKLLDSLLQKTSDAQEKTNDGNLELFYKILQESLKQNTPPLSVLKRNSPKLFTVLKNTNTFIDEYVCNDVAKGKVILRSKSIVFYRLYVELMRRWFIELDIPLSLSAILHNHQKFPALVDRQFPGYVAAGLLLDVLDRSAQGGLSRS